MANFKFVVSEPETRKSVQIEVDQSKATGVIGKKVGDDINGDILGLTGYTLKITGGTDRDGFPMHPSVKGPGRKRVLLSGPPGFYPKLEGQRKRKTVRGNTISDGIVQINVKVVKKGEKSLEELFPAKSKEEKPKAEEKPKEAEKKVEKHKEEKTKEPDKKVEEKPVEAKKEEKVKEKPKEPEKKEESPKTEPEKKEKAKPEEKKPEVKEVKEKGE